jgi:hypothetical protein
MTGRAVGLYLSTRPPRRVVQHTALMTPSRSQLRRWIFSASAIFSGLVSALPWDGAKPTEAGAAAAGYAMGWTPKPTEAPIPRFGSGSEGYSPYDPKGLFRRDQNTDRLCGYVSGDIGEEPPPSSLSTSRLTRKQKKVRGRVIIRLRGAPNTWD